MDSSKQAERGAYQNGAVLERRGEERGGDSSGHS